MSSERAQRWPPRAEDVGSLLRLQALLERLGDFEGDRASVEMAKGRDTRTTRAVLEDELILEALTRQLDAGLDVLTDGELRRSFFTGGLDVALRGFQPSMHHILFENAKGETRLAPARPTAGGGADVLSPLRQVPRRVERQERDGNYTPLRHVPKGPTAAVGLVSTKTTELEAVDDFLRELEEASRHLAVDQLALSPQCGFGTVAGKTPADETTQWRKRAMVGEVADRVWPRSGVGHEKSVPGRRRKSSDDGVPQIHQPRTNPRRSTMELVETPLEPTHLQRNKDDFDIVRQIAESGRDTPVLMVNMNRYSPEAGFPDGELYRRYITGLGPFLEGADAKLLWRFPVLGQAVGDQRVDEILAAWYPRHSVFLNLYEAPGAAENFRLKGLCVEYAVIHRCPGDAPPFAPANVDTASAEPQSR